MGKKIAAILRGEIISSLFYIILGLCLVLVPAQTVNIICKVIFGLVLIGSGLYHIYIYIKGKKTSTILDLFTGVIVLVIGGFLFFNPPVVIKLLPLLLGGFVLVDSIWTIQGSFQLKKRRRREWQGFLIGSLIFVVLGILLMINPFTKIKTTILFAGWTLLVNGIVDLVFYFLLKKGMKAEEIVVDSGQTEEVEKMQETIKKEEPEVQQPEVQQPEVQQPELEPEVQQAEQEEKLEEWKD